MSSFEQIVAFATARGAEKVPGVVLTAVNKEGETIYSHCSGSRSLHADSLPIHPTNVFSIASCTKLVASIAALQCVERGQITLDESVSTWLPELAQLPVISGTAKNMKFTQPKGFITLRQLITHSSGLGYDSLNQLLLAWRESRGEEARASLALITDGFATPLLFEPGEGWQYGSGLDWAGLLVARLNNTTLEDYLQSHVFEPLELDNTTFHLEDRRDMRRRLVKVYKRKVTGGLQETDLPYPSPPHDENGGNGLFSTPYEFMQILQDLVSTSPKLLRPATVEMMFTPQFAEGSEACLKLRADRGVASGMCAPLAKGEINHGLGGMLCNDDIDGVGSTAGTLVWAGLCNWVWFANRRKGFAALYASHVLPPAEPESAKLQAAFVKEMFRRTET